MIISGPGSGFVLRNNFADGRSSRRFQFRDRNGEFAGDAIGPRR